MCCEKMELFDLTHILHLQQKKCRNLYTEMGAIAVKVVTLGRWMFSEADLTQNISRTLLGNFLHVVKSLSIKDRFIFR